MKKPRVTVKIKKEALLKRHKRNLLQRLAHMRNLAFDGTGHMSNHQEERNELDQTWRQLRALVVSMRVV